MPVLIVYGISGSMVGQLEQYTETLINTVACSVKELNLEAKDVSVFFPKDLMSKGLGEEIIIFLDGLDGLFTQPERAGEIKSKLSQAIIETTREHFSDTGNIQCYVRSYDRDQGQYLK